tara:strand:+ start:401 stop:1273 length:873 start_codon:yes stop_codon:yes gene_type:complete
MIIGINPIGLIRDERGEFYHTHPVLTYDWGLIDIEIKRIYHPKEIDEIDVYYQLAYHEHYQDSLEYAIKKEKMVIIHWLGFDVWRFMRNDFSVENPSIISIANSEINFFELKSFGVPNLFLNTIPPKNIQTFSPTKLGKYISVHAPNNSDFYFSELLKDVAVNMPQERFIFYANRELIVNLPENAKTMSFTDENTIKKLIKKSKIHLRFSKHDGFPHSVMQHKLMGRYVISNHDYPLISKVETTTDEIIKEIESTPNIEDIEGSIYYEKNFSPTAFLLKFNDIIKRIGRD